MPETAAYKSLIAADASLASLLAQLEGDTRIAVDTEFLRESTYFPRLCLVQIAGREALGLVDTLAGFELGPLLQFLAERSRSKVLHAAHQDLEIFAHASQAVPGPIFDTQLAAGLVGYAPQIGFGDLVREVLGVSLTKGLARTDWSRRPLSAAQLEYARDDVRYLLPLADALTERLERTGRSAWFAEDARGAEDLTRYVQDPATAWERLKWAHSLSGARLAATQRIAAWREERALRHDRPRGWILSDVAISELIERMPKSRADLERLRELPPAVLSRCGAELLELTAAPGEPSTAQIRDTSRLDPTQMALVKKLGEELRRIAAELGLGAEVLATQKELRALVRGERDVGVLSGWRRAVAGDALTALLR